MNNDKLLQHILWALGLIGLAFFLELLFSIVFPAGLSSRLVLILILTGHFLLQLCLYPSAVGKPSLFLVYSIVLIIAGWINFNPPQLLIVSTLMLWLSRLILYRYRSLIALLDLIISFAAIGGFLALYLHHQTLAMALWAWLLIQCLVALLPFVPRKPDKAYSADAARDFENHVKIAETALEAMVHNAER